MSFRSFHLFSFYCFGPPKSLNNPKPIPPTANAPSPNVLAETKAPVAAKDCKVANADPAATAPIDDCAAAAIDPAAIPADVKPAPVKAILPTATVPPKTAVPTAKFFTAVPGIVS